MNRVPPEDVDVVKGGGAVNGEAGEGVWPKPAPFPKLVDVEIVGWGRVRLLPPAGEEG